MTRHGRYLVAGGAGYIGSHLVAALLDRGRDVVVLDNLSTGHAGAVRPDARLVVGDAGDAALLDTLLADGPWNGVFHLAGPTERRESMTAPLRTFRRTLDPGAAMIEACIRHGVGPLVLTSSAAVYGDTASQPVSDNTPPAPVSPYGESLWMLERYLRWADRLHGLRSAVLRVFDLAGCDPAGDLAGQRGAIAGLIPHATEAALGQCRPLEIYGTDHPMPDSNGIRNQVDVADVAEAHVQVLDAMGDASCCYNLETRSVGGRWELFMESNTSCRILAED